MNPWAARGCNRLVLVVVRDSRARGAVMFYPLVVVMTHVHTASEEVAVAFASQFHHGADALSSAVV